MVRDDCIPFASNRKRLFYIFVVLNLSVYNDTNDRIKKKKTHITRVGTNVKYIAAYI